jgi:hypothetical protein
MTPTEKTEPAERITLDDVKHRAEAVANLAISDTKAAVSEVVRTDSVKRMAILAGVIIVAASVAYFAGTKAPRVRQYDSP